MTEKPNYEELKKRVQELEKAESKRKRAEEALRESEAKYKNIYKNTPVMLHSIDTNGVLTGVSNHWLEVMGYEENEVIGKKSTDFLTETSKKYAKVGIKRKMEQFFL